MNCFVREICNLYRASESWVKKLLFIMILSRFKHLFFNQKLHLFYHGPNRKKFAEDDSVEKPMFLIRRSQSRQSESLRNVQNYWLVWIIKLMFFIDSHVFNQLQVWFLQPRSQSKTFRLRRTIQLTNLFVSIHSAYSWQSKYSQKCYLSWFRSIFKLLILSHHQFGVRHQNLNRKHSTCTRVFK